MEYAECFQRKLVIQDKKRFDETLLFSGENVSEENILRGKDLIGQIQYLLLGHYGNADTLVISPDSIPNCFYFSIVKNDTMLFNGGIICHGQGIETFSCELSPSKGIYFSIHT